MMTVVCLLLRTWFTSVCGCRIICQHGKGNAKMIRQIRGFEIAGHASINIWLCGTVVLFSMVVLLVVEWQTKLQAGMKRKSSVSLLCCMRTMPTLRWC
jgi:hypothetical protein